MYSAYFDRVTDNKEALLLVEELNKEYTIPLHSLPGNVGEGTWFLIELQNEEITSIKADIDKTNDMHNQIKDQIQRLKSKKKSRFKRK